MSDKKKSFMSPPPPVKLSAPEFPEGYEPPRRGRGVLPELDAQGMPVREASVDRGFEAHKAAQRKLGVQHPEKPYAGEPRRAMPAPPPPIRPGEMPRRRKQNEPVRGTKKSTRKTPSFFARFLRVKVNMKYVSIVSWGIAAIAFLAIAGWFIMSLLVYNSFEVFLDGESIGFIPYSEDLTSEDFHNYAVLSLQAARGGATVNVEQRVTIEPARASTTQRGTRSDILGILTRRFRYTIAATEIYVDGEFRALIRTQSDLEHVKHLLQERWFNENTVGAEFVDGWEERILNVHPDETEFCTPEEAYWRLDVQTMQMYLYTVVLGDNLGNIAVAFGTTVDAIMRDNGLTSTNIRVGDELYIYTRRPLLTVRTFDEIASFEIIEMPVETIYNPALPQAFTNVIQEGQAGQQEVITRITRENGTERYREILEPQIIIQPITHIIEVGTGAGGLDVR